MVTKLRDLAYIVRSKNAGPYEITFDVLCRTKEEYDHVKASGLLRPELFARLYDVQESECNFLTYDGGFAFKCTIPRRVVSGDIGDSDCYGAQQHAPLLDLEVPDAGL